MTYTNENQSQRKTNRYIVQDRQLQQKLKSIRPNSAEEQPYNESYNSKIKNYQYLMFEKKLQKIIERKVEQLVEKYCEKYFMKFKEAESLSMIDLIRDVEKETKTRIQKVEKSYAHIIETYDNFLAIVQTMKDKWTKTDKFFKKKQFQTFFKRYQQDISSMGDKIATLSHYLE